MILDKFKLTDKVAIVTGGGRSIGRGIALGFAEAGADVVCTARTAAEIESVAAEIRSLGRKALAIQCDVCESDQIESMVKKTFEEFGRIDILVNNAGASHLKSAMETTEQAWEQQLRLNLTSAFLCSKAAARHMLQQRSGAIVNISSRAGNQPAVGMIAYGVSKAGMHELTVTMSHELAPYVRVNCIAAGVILTETSEATFAQVKEKFQRVIPLNRLGTTEDVALAALYLASPASSWVTGNIFEIDGGVQGPIFKPGGLMKQAVA